MKLYVSYGNSISNEWEKIGEFELKLLVDSYSIDNKVFGLNAQTIFLPNNEEIELNVAYSIDNKGISIIVNSNNQTLINVGGFKSSYMAYDPSIIFLTPKGLHLSLMVGD